jgi:hypothetical protein
VALYHEASDLSERGNGLADAVAASIQETGFLDRVADPASGLVTFSHKEPYKNNEGGYALNFFGRCQLAHPVNTQMEDDNGQVVMQLCQWEDDKFSLDFRLWLCRHPTPRILTTKIGRRKLHNRLHFEESKQ